MHTIWPVKRPMHRFLVRVESVALRRLTRWLLRSAQSPEFQAKHHWLACQR